MMHLVWTKIEQDHRNVHLMYKQNDNDFSSDWRALCVLLNDPSLLALQVRKGG